MTETLNRNQNKQLTSEQRSQLLKSLKARFEANRDRHQELDWAQAQARLDAQPEKLWSLFEMGIELLSENEYRDLQLLGEFDLKTSSWVKTPHEIRALGGALFCDRRYNTVFVYHNGAQSYYGARGFRGSLRV